MFDSRRQVADRRLDHQHQVDAIDYAADLREQCIGQHHHALGLDQRQHRRHLGMVVVPFRHHAGDGLAARGHIGLRQVDAVEQRLPCLAALVRGSGQGLQMLE
ncbi:hypothetical protein D3C87_1797580 [compost metagenome]